MSNTLREEIHKSIKTAYWENTARCVVTLVMPLVNPELESSEQRWLQKGREEMRKECLELIKERENRIVLPSTQFREENNWYNKCLKSLRTAISSLK